MMKPSEYEFLRNKGFKIYKISKKKIYIRGNKYWSVVCNYSEARWTEIQADAKAVVDNEN